MSLAVGKIVRRLDKHIFSVARPAKTPYSITTTRLYCKTEKADGKNPHFKEAGLSSPFNHKVSEWDKKLLVWSGRFKKGEDIPQDISAKTMSASRSKLRVKDVQKYRSLRYMNPSIEQIEEAAESASAKP